MFGVTNEAWDKEQVIIFSNSDEKELILCGDGRSDSSGHNAKYLTFSQYDKIQKRVIVISLTQVTEVDSSNRMDKAGLIKTLQEVKEKEHKSVPFRSKNISVNKKKILMISLMSGILENPLKQSC